MGRIAARSVAGLLATGRAATTTRQRRRTVGAVVYIGLVLALFVVIPS
jgi:hypothetical protein